MIAEQRSIDTDVSSVQDMCTRLCAHKITGKRWRDRVDLDTSPLEKNLIILGRVCYAACPLPRMGLAIFVCLFVWAEPRFLQDRFLKQRWPRFWRNARNGSFLKDSHVLTPLWLQRCNGCTSCCLYSVSLILLHTSSQINTNIV
jgi:hypothetical protein